ncbi:hypothetical protein Ciccas_007125, partial [Cichlidogyrus casuarinus]
RASVNPIFFTLKCPFSGLVRLAPTKPPPIPQLATKNALKHILRVAYPERWRLAGGVLLLFLSSGVTLSIPHWLGLLIDRSTGQVNTSNFSLPSSSFHLVLIALFGLGAVCNGGRVYLFKSSGIRMAVRMRNAFFRSIVSRYVYPYLPVVPISN